MKHVKALIIKFLMITIMLFLVLGLFYGVDFGDIITISIVLTVGAYIIGDLFILPRFRNVIATLADFGLAFIGVWVLGDILIEENIPLTTAALLSAVLIGVGEWFFHKYVIQIIRESPKRNDFSTNRLQTEFASENDAQSLKNKEDK
jgi:hypothetical protein